jgi:hypothetical protein
MSTINRRRPRRGSTSAGGPRAAGQAGDGQTGHGHTGHPEDGIACLDVLAAQMHARGWTAYISTPAGRLASLCVQDPHDRRGGGDIIAAPDGTTGNWWYWFSWAERIAPVHAPAAAADGIIRALQRPPDGPQARRAPVAGHAARRDPAMREQ